MSSGLSVSLANVTGGLPGSGTDGTVPFKVRCWQYNSGVLRRCWPAGQRQQRQDALQGVLSAVYTVDMLRSSFRMSGSDTNSSVLLDAVWTVYLHVLPVYLSIHLLTWACMSICASDDTMSGSLGCKSKIDTSIEITPSNPSWVD